MEASYYIVEMKAELGGRTCIGHRGWVVTKPGESRFYLYPDEPLFMLCHPFPV